MLIEKIYLKVPVLLMVCNIIYREKDIYAKDVTFISLYFMTRKSITVLTAEQKI